MEIWRTTRAVLRTRSAMVTVIVVAFVSALAVFLAVPSVYVSRATLVLTTSSTGPSLDEETGRPEEVSNPLLGFDASLNGALDVLITVLSTPELSAELGAPEGGPTTLLLTSRADDPALLGATAPFLFVVGESTDPDEAVAVVNRASVRVQQELSARQRALAAPPGTFVTLLEIRGATEPTTDVGTVVQNVVVGFAGGTVLAIGALIAAAGLRDAAARRRPAPGEDRAGESEDGSGESDAGVAESADPRAGPGVDAATDEDDPVLRAPGDAAADDEGPGVRSGGRPAVVALDLVADDSPTASLAARPPKPPGELLHAGSVADNGFSGRTASAMVTRNGTRPFGPAATPAWRPSPHPRLDCERRAEPSDKDLPAGDE